MNRLLEWAKTRLLPALIGVVTFAYVAKRGIESFHESCDATCDYQGLGIEGMFLLFFVAVMAMIDFSVWNDTKDEEERSA